ncbi:MAG: hypothetical protein ACUVXA_18915 [Candidatus Jordarchaeum sp.]|uniref:hypothetical protein n=1 Tax=Candidatus Jordarchaeum sp. TaxID=2823881 RepID=UPI004049CF8A
MGKFRTTVLENVTKCNYGFLGFIRLTSLEFIKVHIGLLSGKVEPTSAHKLLERLGCGEGSASTLFLNVFFWICIF